MSNPMAPCKECEVRHPHCHSECEAYNEYKKSYKAYKELRDAAKRLENEVNSLLMDSREKERRR